MTGSKSLEMLCWSCSIMVRGVSPQSIVSLACPNFPHEVMGCAHACPTSMPWRPSTAPGRPGDGNWPGLAPVRLSSEQLFVVCSPKLLSGKRRISKPADILKFPLIHMDSRADWKNWLEKADLDDAAATHGPVLNRASMVIDAAINGQGIALARTTLAAWDLIKGHLARPFAQSLTLNKAYWIICPKATASLPKIVTFRDWLLAEAASDLRQLRTSGRATR